MLFCSFVSSYPQSSAVQPVDVLGVDAVHPASGLEPIQLVPQVVGRHDPAAAHILMLIFLYMFFFEENFLLF